MTPTHVSIFLVVIFISAGPIPVQGTDQEQPTESQVSTISELPQVPPNLNRGFQIVRRPAKEVHASLSLTIWAPSLEADTWVFAVPEPPELPGQDVLRCVTIPRSSQVTDKSALRRSIRRCRIEADTKEGQRSAGIRCEADLRLYTRSLTFGGSSDHRKQAERLSPNDRLLYLRPSVECDYTSDGFRAWKKEHKFHRTRGEGEIRFAQRMFAALAQKYRYLYVPQQDRMASAVCQTNKTDCGGLSTLLATVMRSEGIPARVLAGRWAKSARKGETVDGQQYFQYHVIAEFYAQGVGWIPVDLASAILHDRTDAKLQYFGQDAGNFIVLHVDTGVEFDTDLFGDYRAVYFQIPLFWVRGRGSLEDRIVDEGWIVTPQKSATIGEDPCSL